MGTLFSILAWRIPWTEEPGGSHTVHRVAKSQTQLSTHRCSMNYHHLASHSKIYYKKIPESIKNRHIQKATILKRVHLKTRISFTFIL